jgi:hypothetical protein
VADPVFVHIGPPKTGTTYLQAVLWSNRAILKDQGVLVPGRSPVSQFHAAVDLLERDPTRVGADRTAGSWVALVDEVRAWTGRAVISHENFGYAEPEQAERAKLAFDAKEIHVVFTAREFSRIVPAMWQERLKNRSDDTWVDYLALLGESGPRTATAFWHQNTGAGLLAWAAGLPPENVHIVTVPPSGAPPTLLWERFASVIGVDPASCTTDVPRSNESLGVVESAFLRRFNTATTDLGWESYRAHVKHFLAPQVLARRVDSARIEVRSEEITPLTERASQLVDAIKTHGFDVVGDLADLVPSAAAASAEGRSGHATDDVTDTELLAVAFDAVAGLADHAEDLRQARQEQVAATRDVRRELRDTRRRLDELRAVNRRLHTRLDLADAELARPPVRRAISRFCDRHRWAGRLRGLFRRSPRQPPGPS